MASCMLLYSDSAMLWPYFSPYTTTDATVQSHYASHSRQSGCPQSTGATFNTQATLYFPLKFPYQLSRERTAERSNFSEEFFVQSGRDHKEWWH